MIEVSAKLIKGPVYLAGESVECYITFSNPQASLHKRSQSNNDLFECLALATAQIHCQCSTSNKVVTSDNSSYSVEQLSVANTSTSFAPCRGETGHVVLSTKPKILFCDLRLSTAESKSYLFKETLPCDAPPSYRGQAVKYSYKITIGMQRVNTAIKLLRIPFRVLVVTGFPDTSLCGDSEDLGPSNPFLEVQKKETPFELAVQMLQNITAKRSPNFYNITNSRGKVVRFCLFKQAYKVGEDIVGTFDFTDAPVPCVQVLVVLQSSEEIAEECSRSPGRAPVVTSYNKFHEMCLGLKCSQLILPIPLHVTPTFSTNIVSLQWRLHFEFVTSQKGIQDLHSAPDPDTQGSSWQGPSVLNIETMVWNLPIKIYPTMPLHVSHGLHAQSKFKDSI